MNNTVHCPIGDSESILGYEVLTDDLYGSDLRVDIYRCQSQECKHEFVPPLPGAAAIREAYTRYSTHSYSDTPVGLAHRVYQALVRMAGFALLPAIVFVVSIVFRLRPGIGEEVVARARPLTVS
ncbi:MAG: hypothetical protein OEZ10_06615 [Gammaproteobacteria bacterium]|nr:hypothetical protein [Gammaproteobacteria bacterium]